MIKIIKNFHAFFKKPIYSIFLKPLLLLITPVIFSVYNIYKHTESFSEIKNWIGNNFIIVFIIFFITVCIVMFEDVIKYLVSKDIALSRNANFILLKALDYPVAKKENRFLNTLNDFREDYIEKDKYPTAGTIFKNITQPEKQIVEIVRSIHMVFETLATEMYGSDSLNFNFRTNLFEIDNNIVTGNLCYFPESDKMREKIVRDTDSLVAQAISSNNKDNIIIIDNIKKEHEHENSRISKYCVSNEGSALAYLIRCNHTNNIPFVIRIVVEHNFFNSKQKSKYKDILKYFEKRILIEYALKEMKNNVIKTKKC